jgi:hypothetical protein
MDPSSISAACVVRLRHQSGKRVLGTDGSLGVRMPNANVELVERMVSE